MNIKPLCEDTNKQLRELYLRTLQKPVSYDGGKTLKPRGQYVESFWSQIQQWKNPTNVIERVGDPLNDIWFISDTHFGHNNIIKFSDRPFENLQHMTDGLVNNFNACVKSNDVSIWVGDVAFMNENEAQKLVKRLNGYKILVVGNHDIFKKNKRIMNLGFDEYHITYNLQFDSTVVAITHYPIDSGNLPKGWINVHGHLHRNGHHADEIDTPTHINVNCEFWNYTPINIKTLHKKIITNRIINI